MPRPRAAIIALHVSAASACFTRHDHTRQRLTYPVMPPTAARGLLETIVFDHRFWWKVHRIDVCSPIVFRTETRQEFNFGTEGGDSEKILLREGVLLESPAYVVFVEPIVKAGVTDKNQTGVVAEARRKIERGQAWGTPYLGTRENMADFRLASPEDGPYPVDMDLTLPIRLFDEVPFDPNAGQRHLTSQRAAVGSYNPVFVPLQVRAGRMSVTAESRGWTLA